MAGKDNEVYILKIMYREVKTNVRSCGGVTENFSITMDLHQGSAQSLFLFVAALDETTRLIKKDVLLCMLFVDALFW